jgi:hypothetical protein
MAKKPLNADRLRGGVSDVVSKAVEATVYLPLGIYDRTRDQLTDLDATRLRETFQGLVGDLIDRGEDRVQPLERRLRREGRKVEAGMNETVSDAKRTTRKVKKTTARAKKTTRTTARKGTARATAASNTEPKLPRVTTPRTAGELPIDCRQARVGNVWRVQRTNDGPRGFGFPDPSRFVNMSTRCSM